MKVVSGHWQVVGLISALLSGAGISYAQQPTRIPRLGIATGNRESISTHELQRGLRELGYIEGIIIVSEYRFYGEKFEGISTVVNELVQSKVDVLVLSNFRAIRAAKEATKTVPIVMVTTQNPVEPKIVDSLARPEAILRG